MSANNTGVCDIPGNHPITFQLPVHAAATASEIIATWRARAACKIRAIWFTPATAGTGDNTNTTNLNFINKGVAAAGTTEVGHIDFTLAIDMVACVPIVVKTAAETTLTAFSMAATEVLAVQAEKAGTGLLIAAGGTVSMDVEWL